MNKHAILFDFDGTVMNSLASVIGSFHHVLDLLGEPPRTDEDITRFFGGGPDRILLKLLKGDQKRAAGAFDLFLQHQSTLAGRTKMFDGIRELLDTMKSNGIPAALVTGRHELDLAMLLAPHRLAESFAALISDNLVKQSKPSPEGALLACKKMGVDPKNTFFVGDATFDMQAAHAAGSVPVAALWDDLSNRAELERERPTYIVEHPTEVWDHFQQYFGIK